MQQTSTLTGRVHAPDPELPRSSTRSWLVGSMSSSLKLLFGADAPQPMPSLFVYRTRSLTPTRNTHETPPSESFSRLPSPPQDEHGDECALRRSRLSSLTFFYLPPLSSPCFPFRFPRTRQMLPLSHTLPPTHSPSPPPRFSFFFFSPRSRTHVQTNLRRLMTPPLLLRLL